MYSKSRKQQQFDRCDVELSFGTCTPQRGSSHLEHAATSEQHCLVPGLILEYMHNRAHIQQQQ
jgi:hypothetical protein